MAITMLQVLAELALMQTRNFILTQFGNPFNTRWLRSHRVLFRSFLPGDLPL